MPLALRVPFVVGVGVDAPLAPFKVRKKSGAEAMARWGIWWKVSDLKAVGDLYQSIMVGTECCVEHEGPRSHTHQATCRVSCTLSSPLEQQPHCAGLGNISHFGSSCAVMSWNAMIWKKCFLFLVLGILYTASPQLERTIRVQDQRLCFLPAM